MKMLLLLFPDKWKYYINLTGEEFPLVTNAELVSILSRLKGTNAAERRLDNNKDRFPRVLPAGLQKYKSSAHVVLSADAVRYIITNQTISHALLHAIAPYSVNDESFFGVLQFNDPNITGFSGAAGAMRGFTRYKLWNQKCLSGNSVRQICIFGVNDLQNLVKKAFGRSLFANNFLWGFQPMAWDCMQEWHHARIAEELRTGQTALNATSFLSRFHLPNN